jgi:proteasome alpha subunit
MSMPFYVAPEQLMKDKADYARKGIARGRSLVALVYADGILLVGENPSRTLHKISEIYDRIAFAGVGKFNEFDQLRQAGVRHADVKGYTYSREDVDAKSLANAYAQTIGQVFTHEMKPLEIEILVAEVGLVPEKDALYHILYDGTVMDESGFSVLGGEAEAIAERLDDAYETGLSLDAALHAAVDALNGDAEGDERLLPEELEVAVLDRVGHQRAFRRVSRSQLVELLPEYTPADDKESNATGPDDTETKPKGKK